MEKNLPPKTTLPLLKRTAMLHQLQKRLLPPLIQVRKPEPDIASMRGPALLQQRARPPKNSAFNLKRRRHDAVFFFWYSAEQVDPGIVS
jgi:hypothetical protein